MNVPIVSALIDGPDEMQRQLGKKAKALRLHMDYKRITLSEKSGVSSETIRNFEQSGKITLENFLKIADALGELEKMHGVFDLPASSVISDIETLPKRGRR